MDCYYKRVMKIANSLLFLLCIILLSPLPALSLTQTKKFRPGWWELSADSSYVYSDSNFTSSGSNSSLLSGNNYQLFEVDGQLRYVLDRHWALLGGAQFAYGQSKGYDANRTNSALTGMMIGAQYALLVGGYDLVPELTYFYPFESVKNGSDAVMISEGVSEFSAKMYLQIPTQSYLMLGSIGYIYRSHGRSSLMPWSAACEIPFTTKTFGAELYGFQSLNDDSDKGNTLAENARNTQIFQVNGGSQKFYSLNPSVIDTLFYARFEAGRHMYVTIGGGLAVAGASYAAGPHVFLSLKHEIGTTVARKKGISVPVNIESRLHTDSPQKTFKEDTEDGVDQTLFEPPPVPADEEVVPKPLPPPQPSEEQVQKKLDDFEMNIELKRKKKKKK